MGESPRQTTAVSLVLNQLIPRTRLGARSCIERPSTSQRQGECTAGQKAGQAAETAGKPCGKKGSEDKVRQ